MSLYRINQPIKQPTRYILRKCSWSHDFDFLNIFILYSSSNRSRSLIRIYSLVMRTRETNIFDSHWVHKFYSWGVIMSFTLAKSRFQIDLGDKFLYRRQFFWLVSFNNNYSIHVASSEISVGLLSLNHTRTAYHVEWLEITISEMCG